jgi:hypothetical protein
MAAKAGHFMVYFEPYGLKSSITRSIPGDSLDGRAGSAAPVAAGVADRV